MLQQSQGQVDQYPQQPLLNQGQNVISQGQVNQQMPQNNFLASQQGQLPINQGQNQGQNLNFQGQANQQMQQQNNYFPSQQGQLPINQGQPLMPGVNISLKKHDFSLGRNISSLSIVFNQGVFPKIPQLDKNILILVSLSQLYGRIFV